MANSDRSGAMCAPPTIEHLTGHNSSTARRCMHFRSEEAMNTRPACRCRSDLSQTWHDRRSLIADLGDTAVPARQLQEPATSCRPLGAQDLRLLGRKEFRVYSGPLHEMAALTDVPRVTPSMPIDAAKEVKGHWICTA